MHGAKTRTIIRNVLIMTMKEGDRPFRGDIVLEGSRIASVGPSVTSQHPGDEIISGEGMAAMPGLINAHQHSPMTLLRAFSDDLKLMDWLERKMFPAEARMTEEDIYWGAQLAMAEMIRSGTTAFADMYIHMEQIATAVAETGMRASLARGLALAEDDGGKRLAEGWDLIERWSGQANGRITTMLGPHSPYLCPPEPLKELIGEAGRKRIPIHIHLAETVEETAIIRERYGKTPTEYLHDLGLFDEAHVLLAHAVHLSASDIRLLRGMRGGAAHNPVSNAKLGCGIAPVAALMEQGVAVGIGTDGAGSATTLDMFAEIRAAAWLQKLAAQDPTALPAGRVLRMATAGSARLLGIDSEVGTLEAGKKADLLLIDLRQPHLQPLHDPEAVIAYAAAGGDVDSVFVDGVPLMRSRRLLTIDEEKLLAEAAVRAARIVEGV